MLLLLIWESLSLPSSWKEENHSNLSKYLSEWNTRCVSLMVSLSVNYALASFSSSGSEWTKSKDEWMRVKVLKDISSDTNTLGVWGGGGRILFSNETSPSLPHLISCNLLPHLPLVQIHSFYSCCCLRMERMENLCSICSSTDPDEDDIIQIDSRSRTFFSLSLSLQGIPSPVNLLLLLIQIQELIHMEYDYLRLCVFLHLPSNSILLLCWLIFCINH